jgi:hypothetical protein
MSLKSAECVTILRFAQLIEEEGKGAKGDGEAMLETFLKALEEDYL